MNSSGNVVQGGASECMYPVVIVDFMLIVPYERQLVKHNGIISIKGKREKNIYSPYLGKPTVLGFPR